MDGEKYCREGGGERIRPRRERGDRRRNEGSQPASSVVYCQYEEKKKEGEAKFFSIQPSNFLWEPKVERYEKEGGREREEQEENLFQILA